MSAPDCTWADMARATRDALALLGRPIKEPCLPDESAPCGGSFALHTAAHMAALQAIIGHQLLHLGPQFQGAFAQVYDHTVTELAQGCGNPTAGKTP